MVRAGTSGADALILDLGIDGAERAAARQRVIDFMASRDDTAPAVFVMVAAIGTPECEDDIRTLTAARPAGFVLQQATGGADVTRLAALLGAAEADIGIDDGATAIVPLATQTPAAILGLATYVGSSSRLLGLAWDALSLKASLGSRAIEDESGALTTPYSLARNQCLISAMAAGLHAIDRAEPGEGRAFINSCNEAWRDGFAGKIATSPAQVPVINGVFGV